MGRQLQKRGWWRTASGLLTLTGAITVSIAACSAEAAAPSTAPPTTEATATTDVLPVTGSSLTPVFAMTGGLLLMIGLGLSAVARTRRLRS